MYHGKKRETEVKELTQEEKQKQEELANKITKMLDEFLEIRHGKKEVEDPLKFCDVMVQLCPEIPHVYNFRREILIKQIDSLIGENKDNIEGFQKSYKMLGGEIMLTLGLLKKRPKCYGIWSHRQWLVQKAFDIENQIFALTKKEITPKVVEQDLAICSKMLKMDERNFHAWNYRLWLVRDVLKYNPKLVASELEYLKQKIEDNFSNFSAFHIRSKQFNVQHLQSIQKETLKDVDTDILNYFLKTEVFDEELDMVKNAIFIQPNEQGVWQYYKWLISLQLPFQIIEAQTLSQDNNQIKIKLTSSQKISNFRQNLNIDSQNIEIVNLQPEFVEKDTEYSYSWILTLNNNDSSSQEVKLSIIENTEIKSEEKLQFATEQVLQKQNLIRSEFLLKFDETKNLQNISKIIYDENNSQQLEKAFELLKNEDEFLQEVIESEPSNTFSHHHSIFMQKSQIYLNVLRKQQISEKDVELIQKALEMNQNLKAIAPRQIKYLEINEQKLELMKSLFEQKKSFFKSQDSPMSELNQITAFEIQEFIPYAQIILNQ